MSKYKSYASEAKSALGSHLNVGNIYNKDAAKKNQEYIAKCKKHNLYDSTTGEFICIFTGSRKGITIDHLVSKAYGGSLLPANCIPVKQSLNSGIGHWQDRFKSNEELTATQIASGIKAITQWIGDNEDDLYNPHDKHLSMLSVSLRHAVVTAVNDWAITNSMDSILPVLKTRYADSWYEENGLKHLIKDE